MEIGHTITILLSVLPSGCKMRPDVLTIEYGDAAGLVRMKDNRVVSRHGKNEFRQNMSCRFWKEICKPAIGKKSLHFRNNAFIMILYHQSNLQSYGKRCGC
jgi:hypothetical protein